MIPVKQIKDIFSYLKKNYPEPLPPSSEIKTYADLIHLNLSHFQCEILNYNKNIDLHNVTHILLENIWVTVGEFAKLIVPLIHNNKRILLVKHPNFLPVVEFYEIKSVKKHGKVVDPSYKYYDIAYPGPKSALANNHYTINSFSINDNSVQLKQVIERLYTSRDAHSSIHFHIEGNGGGDLVPVHLILLCLCGGRRRWMSNYEVIENEDGLIERRHWNPWTPWLKTNDNYPEFCRLNIDYDKLPKYTDLYKGKIIIHMDKYCGSSSWYFITYLTYAFAEKIERYVEYVNGIPIKMGKAHGPQIKFIGYSSTTGGDANSIQKDFKINDSLKNCFFPTQANVSRPVKKNDWNRFWTE
jgi:hypothetical protein